MRKPWRQKQWERFMSQPVETRLLIAIGAFVIFVILAVLSVAVTSNSRKVDNPKIKTRTTVVSTPPVTIIVPGSKGEPGPPGSVVIVPGPTTTTVPGRPTNTTTSTTSTTTPKQPCTTLPVVHSCL